MRLFGHGKQAAEAKASAERDLEIAKSRAVEVRKLSDSLKKLRERNHIAESFEAIFNPREN